MTDKTLNEPMPGTFDQDPIALVWFFGIGHLYLWQQQDILDILGQIDPVGPNDPLRKPFAGVYCNSAGKTTMVILCAGLIAMSKWPGTQIVSTSGSWNQIDTQLWPALKNAVSRLPGWTWNKREVTAPVVEVDGVPLQSRWTPFSTDDPNRAEGHHDQFVVGRSGKRIHIRKAYFIDEAKSVSDGIFDAMARCKVSWKAVLSSAGEDMGAFYKCFHDHSSLWDTRVRPWHLCPHLHNDRKTRAFIESEIRVKGREDPLIKSQYFAEFFQGTGYRVFKSEKIRMAMSGLVRKMGNDRCAAVDWSAGGDEQVIIVRDGNTVVYKAEYHEKDDTALARRLVDIFRAWRIAPHEIEVDAIGGGKVLISILESMGFQGIRRYQSNAKPIDQVTYKNKMTEDAFERVSNILDQISIPKDDVLERQLREREYTVANSDGGKMRLVSKEEMRKHGKESPDRLDTLIMCFSTYRPEMVSKWTFPIDRSGKCPSIRECLKPRDGKTSSVGGGWRGDVYGSSTGGDQDD